VKADDIAVLMYTSGTSGLPKGVMVSYGNLASDVEAAIQHAQLKGSHSFLGILPLFHSTGMLATLVAPVKLGAKTVYQARFSPVGVINAIKEHQISIVAAVPSMYGMLVRLKEAKAEDVKSLYAAISGGEPLPSIIREGWNKKFGAPIYEGYGLTETIGPIAFNVPGAIKGGSVGRPIPGAEVRIVDDDGNTAVHHAAARGDNEMITYLVSKGADVTKINRSGLTTVDMANGPVQRTQPYPETIKLLESLGAKNNHKCVSC